MTEPFHITAANVRNGYYVGPDPKGLDQPIVIDGHLGVIRFLGNIQTTGQLTAGPETSIDCDSDINANGIIIGGSIKTLGLLSASTSITSGSTITAFDIRTDGNLVATDTISAVYEIQVGKAIVTDNDVNAALTINAQNMLARHVSAEIGIHVKNAIVETIRSPIIEGRFAFKTKAETSTTQPART